MTVLYVLSSINRTVIGTVFKVSSDTADDKYVQSNAPSVDGYIIDFQRP